MYDSCIIVETRSREVAWGEIRRLVQYNKARPALLASGAGAPTVASILSQLPIREFDDRLRRIDEALVDSSIVGMAYGTTIARMVGHTVFSRLDLETEPIAPGSLIEGRIRKHQLKPEKLLVLGKGPVSLGLLDRSVSLSLMLVNQEAPGFDLQALERAWPQVHGFLVADTLDPLVTSFRDARHLRNQPWPQP